mmetsp:Transcript_14065/g.26329  ORF Transcript_14065/g.26329 Transcript_14065/m.26329 type:complete len:214 (-) Transcript_14065:2167-2808(-)
MLPRLEPPKKPKTLLPTSEASRNPVQFGPRKRKGLERSEDLGDLRSRVHGVRSLLKEIASCAEPSLRKRAKLATVDSSHQAHFNMRYEEQHDRMVSGIEKSHLNYARETDSNKSRIEDSFSKTTLSNSNSLLTSCQSLRHSFLSIPVFNPFTWSKPSQSVASTSASPPRENVFYTPDSRPVASSSVREMPVFADSSTSTSVDGGPSQATKTQG